MAATASFGRRLPRRAVLAGGWLGLSALAAACSGKGNTRAGVAQPGDATGAAGNAAAATRAATVKRGAVPTPQPPRLTIAVYKPSTGYTSFIADERRIAWLGAAPDRNAVITVADLPGANERIVARPPNPAVALGRPWLAGDWLVYSETQSSAGPGPWAIHAVNLLSGEDLLIDQGNAGWEGLSLASDGQTLAYTALKGPDQQQHAELIVLDLTRRSSQSVLTLAPGRVLQRLAVGGATAAAVETALNGAAVSASPGATPALAVPVPPSTSIVAVNLGTGERTALPSGAATMPAVSGQWVAWVTIPAADAPNAVVLFDRSSGSSATIATAARGTSLHNPSMTAQYLTWNRSDAAIVALYDIRQAATFKLDEGIAGNVWANRGAIIWTYLDRGDNQYKLKIAQTQA